MDDQAEASPVGRRAVTRAGIWTTPAVLVAGAAPAMAASQVCPPATLDWNSIPLGDFTSTTVGATMVSMAMTSLTNVPASSGDVVYADPSGGYTGNRLRFDLSPTFGGSTQTVTFTFSAPVSGLSFTFYDIDAQAFAFSDRVRLNTAGYTSTGGSNVLYNAAGNYFYGRSRTGVPGDSTAGNLDVTYAGEVSSFSFTYFQGGYVALNGSAFVGLSNLSFTPSVC